jgi:hypothetical protein
MPGITRFIFNGKAYSSLDEMPPEARAAYEQAMQRLAEADPSAATVVTHQSLLGPGVEVSTIQFSAVKTKTIVDGHRSYDRIEDLPPDAREAVESAIANLDAKPKKITGVLPWVIALIVLVAVLVAVLVLK